jgi:hypothetical protein
VAFTFTGTGAIPATVQVYTRPTAGVVVGSIAASAITATAIASDAITAAKIADGAIDAATFAAGAITATVIATDAIDNDALAANAVTEIQSGLATSAALDTVDNFLDTEVAAILAAVDTEVAAILALLDDARSEPGQGAPAVNPDAVTKLDYLYKWARNKKDNNGTETKFYADDGTTVDQKQSTAESGGTVTVGEMATGA